MIQRIQTIYLLLVTALVAVTLSLPLASFSAGVEPFTLVAFGLKDATGEVVVNSIYMTILLVLACLLPFVTIFLFKRRMLQIRLCAIEGVLLLGAEAMIFIYYYLADRLFSSFEFHEQSLGVAVALPVMALLFCYLAARAIMRDEVLVRSLDRVR